MGGLVTLVVAHVPEERAAAMRDLRIVMARIERWGARLTRFSEASELSALNRDPQSPMTRIGPTLACVLGAATRVAARTDGAVDVGLLDARLAAEGARGRSGRDDHGRWWLERHGRGGTLHRDGSVRFDLDGIAKGWIADRALGLLGCYPAVLVDADGDIAVRDSVGMGWSIAIADPDPDATDSDLAALALGPAIGDGTWGIATSGTTRHRWEVDGTVRHHIIDPLTRMSARTDVKQATVLASSAMEAEAFAKLAIIKGAEDALPRLERAAIAAILALGDGRARMTANMTAWLAP